MFVRFLMTIKINQIKNLSSWKLITVKFLTGFFVEAFVTNQFF